MKTIRYLTLYLLIISIMSVVVLGDFRKKTAQAEDFSGIVIEQSTGRVLYEHDAKKKRPMASTTKVVTAITAIENYKGNTDDVVTVPDCAVGVEGSSLYLEKGERLRFVDLLYGLMLRSGNDCAVAIAVIVGGNTQLFAEMMNETAKKAGAENSHFVNPHGLHDDAHYTTASDLAKITAYAMNNETFREIVSTKRYATERSREDVGKVIVNKNRLLYSFEGANGVKTGFTKKAGRCLVSSAERNGMTVIAVALNCPQMFEECAKMMEKAFAEYEMVDLSPHGILSYCKVAGEEKYLPLAAGEKRSYPVRKDGKETIGYGISDVKMLKNVPDESIENGKLNIYLDKRLIFFVKLVTI